MEYTVIAAQINKRSSLTITRFPVFVRLGYEVVKRTVLVEMIIKRLTMIVFILVIQSLPKRHEKYEELIYSNARMS